MNAIKYLSLRAFILLAGSIFIVGLSSCNYEKYTRLEGMIWNTTYHITYKGKESLKDSVIPVLNEVSGSLSVFDKSSLVSQLNASDSVEADERLIKIYDKSKEINLLSEGSFDPTVSPLVTAWGFGIGHAATNDTIAIDSILNFVGISKTYRAGNTIFKEDIRTQFNFSAIAKGYGCDAVGEMFLRNGVEDFMVEIGGEISLHGKSPSGKDWNISIDMPTEGENPGNTSACIISLTDKGIATSGNYRNFRKENGTTLAHTISPITGRPFFSGILSATVIAPTCMEADALATACMASEINDAEKILLTYKADGLLIFSDSIWMTPGFKKYVIGESSVPGRKDQN